MGLMELLGLDKETLKLTWGAKLKAIINEITIKDIKLIPNENFYAAKKILKSLELLIQSEKFDALIATCGGIASAFENAKNLKGKFNKDAMIQVMDIKNMANQALKGKKYMLTFHSSEGKFRNELANSLKKLADHMKAYGLQAEARKRTKVF